PGRADGEPPAEPKVKADPAVRRAQFPGAFDDDPIPPRPDDLGPVDDAPIIQDEPEEMPGAPGQGPGTDLVPLPDLDEPEAPRRPGDEGPAPPPINPGSQRVVNIYRGGPDWQIKRLPPAPDGSFIIVSTGGVNVVATSPDFGTVDLSA